MESDYSEEEVYPDLDEDEDKDIELEEELATLENFELPDLSEIPIVFNPPSVYIKTIESLSKDLFQTEQLLSKKIDDLTDIAVKIVENDPEADIESIEASVKEIIDQIATIKSYKHNLDSSKEKIRASGGQILKDAPSKIFVKKAKKDTDQYLAQPSRSRYGASDKFKAFKQSVWEVNHPEEVMPSNWLGIGETSGGEGSDEDVIVSRQVEVLKCPITCVWYDNPVTSSICKHSFSKDAILSLLRKSRGDLACPVAGCSSYITKDCLEPNPNLVRRLDRMKSQQTKEKSQGRNDESTNVFFLD